jgi:hypothetical protein
LALDCFWTRSLAFSGPPSAVILLCLPLE